jgi:hypothetical protein
LCKAAHRGILSYNTGDGCIATSKIHSSRDSLSGPRWHCNCENHRQVLLLPHSRLLILRARTQSTRRLALQPLRHVVTYTKRRRRVSLLAETCCRLLLIGRQSDSHAAGPLVASIRSTWVAPSTIAAIWGPQPGSAISFQRHRRDPPLVLETCADHAHGTRLECRWQTTMRPCSDRIHLDKNNPNVLRDEITTTDDSLTQPWTVTKNYRRELFVTWERIIASNAMPT